jgi:hypothetical protein
MSRLLLSSINASKFLPGLGNYIASLRAGLASIIMAIAWSIENNEPERYD